MTEHTQHPVERRQTNRRQSTRDGKYDRRRNVCGLCRYYQPESPQEGNCLKHEKPIGYQDFACTLFAFKAGSE